jgi:hypothetical protein
MLHGDGDKAGYETGMGYSRSGCYSDPTLQKVMVTLVREDQTATGDCGDFTLSPLPGSSASKNYQLDTLVHTYRAEISGNTIKLLLDKHLLLETSDNTYTNAGQVGLRDVYGSINVMSFKVIAL